MIEYKKLFNPVLYEEDDDDGDDPIPGEDGGDGSLEGDINPKRSMVPNVWGDLNNDQLW